MIPSKKAAFTDWITRLHVLESKDLLLERVRRSDKSVRIHYVDKKRMARHQQQTQEIATAVLTDRSIERTD